MTTTDQTSITTEQLLSACIIQMNEFHHNRPSDDRPCLELFRRALIEHDQEAWSAIYNLHHDQVMRWVYAHPRFRFTGEDASVFANQAFARLWQYGRRHAEAGRFNAVAEYMQYLKRCTWSAIEDELRRIQKDALWHQVELDSLSDGGELNDEGWDFETLGIWLRGEDVPMEVVVEREAVMQELWELLKRSLVDGREHVVAEEIWEYGLTPRQIYVRYPDMFANEGEVRQVRRNILKRLIRRLMRGGRASILWKELECLLNE